MKLIKRINLYIDNFHWKDQINSFLTTAIAIFAVDGVMEIAAVYNGDFSGVALMAFIGAFGRSLIKAGLTVTFPRIFPERVSKKPRG